MDRREISTGQMAQRRDGGSCAPGVGPCAIEQFESSEDWGYGPAVEDKGFGVWSEGLMAVAVGMVFVGCFVWVAWWVWFLVSHICG